MTHWLQSAKLSELGKQAIQGNGSPLSAITGVSDFGHFLHTDPIADPCLVVLNTSLGKDLGLEAESHCHDWVKQHDYLAGVMHEQLQPWSSVYSGHQFGIWAGQLGDGRAHILGEACTQNGECYEVQIKGAGRTPYSRRGDGRAVLRSSLREFLASEALNALGIPSTRALCLLGSTTPVIREAIEQAAIVTRLAPSFIRFGHFEHFAAARDTKRLADLLDFVVQCYYPHCASTDVAKTAAHFLREVVRRSAELVAAWQCVGFCHGVLNTDNMSILGLTLDFGPYGFLETYDPAYICNHSDQLGRYAYQNQPRIVQWNLVCLANALLPIAERESLTQALEDFDQVFHSLLVRRLADKMGLGLDFDPATDVTLMHDWLSLLQQAQAPFSQSFAVLRQLDQGWDHVQHLFVQTLELAKQSVEVNDVFQTWLKRYRERCASDTLQNRALLCKQRNPSKILYNWVAELAIRAAQQGDFTVAQRAYAMLQAPYDEGSAYVMNKPEWAEELCVSCSS